MGMLLATQRDNVWLSTFLPYDFNPAPASRVFLARMECPL
jgi:hypothetical protein